jgi:hypothetical protein
MRMAEFELHAHVLHDRGVIVANPFAHAVLELSSFTSQRNDSPTDLTVHPHPGIGEFIDPGFDVIRQSGGFGI